MTGIDDAQVTAPSATPSSGPVLVCVTGGDGSGKSTQVARLAEGWESSGLSVAQVSVWDAFVHPSLRDLVPFSSVDAVYGYLAVLPPTARTHFLFHALHLALDLARRESPDVIVLNGYWYKYLATEVAHGGDPAALRPLAAAFPVPAATARLVVDPQAALARKESLTDYEQGYDGGVTDPLVIQERAATVMDHLGREFGWTDVDASASPDLVTTRLRSALSDALPTTQEDTP